MGFKFGLKRARKASEEWRLFKTKSNGQEEWVDHRGLGSGNVSVFFEVAPQGRYALAPVYTPSKAG